MIGQTYPTIRNSSILHWIFNIKNPLCRRIFVLALKALMVTFFSINGRCGLMLEYVGDGWAAMIEWNSENPVDTARFSDVPVLIFKDSAGTRYNGIACGEIVRVETNNGHRFILMEASDEN